VSVVAPYAASGTARAQALVRARAVPLAVSLPKLALVKRTGYNLGLMLLAALGLVFAAGWLATQIEDEEPTHTVTIIVTSTIPPPSP
jgi:hypothetical protein